MTAKEAISKIKTMLFCKSIDKYIKETGHEPENNELWQAIKMAIEALQKQIPKKIRVGKVKGHMLDGYHCPNCMEWFVEKLEFEYCPMCGQRIDWGSEKEE